MFMNMNIGFVFITSARAGFVGLPLKCWCTQLLCTIGDVARLPVVADAVVNLVAFAVEDVERRLVHVAVLLRPGPRAPLLDVEVEHLGDAVLRLDVVAAERLRAVGELDLAPLAHARHRPEARELVLQVVVPLERADEDPILLRVVVRFVGFRRHIHPAGIAWV